MRGETRLQEASVYPDGRSLRGTAIKAPTRGGAFEPRERSPDDALLGKLGYFLLPSVFFFSFPVKGEARLLAESKGTLPVCGRSVKQLSYLGLTGSDTFKNGCLQRCS